MFYDDEITSWKLALKPSFSPSAVLLSNWFNYLLNFSQCGLSCLETSHVQTQEQVVCSLPDPLHPSIHLSVFLLRDGLNTVPDVFWVLSRYQPVSLTII